MKRTEHRYVVQDTAPVFEILDNSGFAYKEYAVHTTYLDSNPPTWSIGNGSKKYRIRWYNNDTSEMWFEIKSRKHGKRRRKIKHTKWFGLKAVAGIDYKRHEYTGLEGDLRITVDMDIVSPFRGGFVGSVVETKAKYPVDVEWLERTLPKQDKEFSKSKWVLDQWKTK